MVIWRAVLSRHRIKHLFTILADLRQPPSILSRKEIFELVATSHSTNSCLLTDLAGESRERDVRCFLQNWLSAKHCREPNTVILHELDIPRPSGRVDLAVINGRLAGYEIKSGMDTLGRLPDQQNSFSSVFERMTLVVAERHTRKCIQLVPDWWEIVEFSWTGFRLRRRGRLNPHLNVENMLHLLSKAELQEVEVSLGLNGSRRRAKVAIIQSILRIGPITRTVNQVRGILKRRAIKPHDEFGALHVGAVAPCARSCA